MTKTGNEKALGRGTKVRSIGLWTVQAALALLFVFAGAMKFVMPLEEMTREIAFPGWFLYFIGVAEVLGGLGLVLPLALGIQPRLTPLAALLLVPIMIGATAVSIATGGAAQGVVPAVVGLACAWVARERNRQLRARETAVGFRATRATA